MTLPRSVQEQIDRANEAQKAINAPAEEPGVPGEGEDGGKDPGANPEADSARKPDPAQEPGKGDPKGAQSAEQQQQDLVDGKPATYWKHRFDVLQGKYNAEVPALRKDVSELQRQIKEQAGSDDGDAVKRAQSAVADLTPEEIEEFGPELVSVIQRVAGSVAQKSKPAPDPRIDELYEKDRAKDEDRRQDAEAMFWTDLETAVPDFRTINGDKAFHAYLAEVEPLSGATRQKLLLAAQEAHDAKRVIAIFNGFKGKPVKREIPEESIQVRSVGGGGDALAESQPSGRIWKREDINKFYRDKNAGVYTEAQAKELEADIFAAQGEGRIRQ